MTQLNRIALVATMHSGKTEIARRLINDYGFTRFALADGVKDATVDMINAFLKHIGCEPNFTRATLEADKSALRWLLQGVGTELGRNYFGPESIWIDFFRAKVEAHDGPIVCDDCRFHNEAIALKAMGFRIVRVRRPEVQRMNSIRASVLHQVMASKKTHALGESDIAREVHATIETMLAHPSETNVELIEPDQTVLNTDLVSLDEIAEGLANGRLALR